MKSTTDTGGSPPPPRPASSADGDGTPGKKWPYVIGQQVAQFTVLGRSGNRTLVRCACGRELSVRTDALRVQQSCGKHPDRSVIGHRFGELVITDVMRSAKTVWSYDCDCGNSGQALATNIRSGKTTSCGRHNRDIAGAAARAGLSAEEGRRLYLVWASMMGRCYNPGAARYSRYGARGIEVCAEWHDPAAFLTWSAARASPGLTLDRIDNDGPYCPENCRWSSDADQARNKSTNIWVVAFGERKIAKDWVKDPRCAVQSTTLMNRLHAGWLPEDAIQLPPRTQRPTHTV